MCSISLLRIIYIQSSFVICEDDGGFSPHIPSLFFAVSPSPSFSYLLPLSLHLRKTVVQPLRPCARPFPRKSHAFSRGETTHQIFSSPVVVDFIDTPAPISGCRGSRATRNNVNSIDPFDEGARGQALLSIRRATPSDREQGGFWTYGANASRNFVRRRRRYAYLHRCFAARGPFWRCDVHTTLRSLELLAPLQILICLQLFLPADRNCCPRVAISDRARLSDSWQPRTLFCLFFQMRL